MTICIGAICDGGQTIAWAADTRLSLGHVSADVPFAKGGAVHDKWIALFSGNDISQADEYLARVANVLSPRDSERTATEVEAAFREQYRHHLRERAEQEVLGVYGLTMEQFLANGQQMFGEAGFLDLRTRIEAIDLGCVFLVLGFDRHKRAHLFTVEHPGHVRTYTRVGVWAIGSGAPSAISSLFFHRYHPPMPLQIAIYLLCAAKFMAESADGVGQPTFVDVIRADGERAIVPVANVEKVHEKWEAEGQPRIPEGIKVFMDQQIRWNPNPSDY